MTAWNSGRRIPLARFRAGLLILWMAMSISYLQAEHIIGGMFTYTCLGYLNNDPATGIKVYRMTLRVYRDCQGGGSDFDSTGDPAPTATITIYRDGVPAPFDTEALLAPVVRSVDPDPGNPCLEVPPVVCVEEGVYEFELELPVSTESYHVVYQRCCRNATLNNLVDPANVGATFAVEITPLAQQTCNSAPDFQNLPPVVFCVNNAFTFDLSATDAEGDSLAYRLCSPWDGGGTVSAPITDPNGLAPDPDQPPPFSFVPFVSPTFSAERPLGTSAQLTLDPVSGELSGLTAQQGQFVIGICVAEYRDGQLLSEVRREIQINTTVCDDALEASILSDGIGPNGEFLVRNCGLENIEVTNLSERQSLISGYRWEINLDTGTYVAGTRDLTFSVPAAGRIDGRLILNPGALANCRDTADLIFDLFPALDADISASYDSCVYGPVQFQSQVIAPGGGLQVGWDFGDGNVSSEAAPAHTYDRAGDYLVRFTAIDQNGCVDTLFQPISYFPLPPEPVLQPQSGCAPLLFSLPPPPAWLTDDYNLSWSFGNGEIRDTWPEDYSYEQAGQFDISWELQSPTGCRLSADYPAVAVVSASPAADFSFSPDPPDFLDPTISFLDRSTGADSWQWDFGGLGSSVLQNPVFTFPDTGTYEVVLEVVSANGCTDSAGRLIVIRSENTFFLPNAFTPNGDQLNDVFIGKGVVEGIQAFEFSVWNRYGEAIFSSNDPLVGWNGRRNNSGNLQPQGMYVYVVRFTDINGQSVSKKGEVMLIY